MDALPFVLLCSTAWLLVAMTTGLDHNSNKNCKTMATFNVGLMNGVGQQQIRLPGIIDALRRSEDDFLCLQEVWFENDMTVILESVKSQFPHHWSKIHAAKDYLREPADAYKELKDTPCRIGEAARLAEKLYECGAQRGCFNLTGMEQSLCLGLQCMDIFKCRTIQETCISCAYLKAPLPVEEALKECVLPSKNNNRVNEPGLLVLSKKRLNRVSYDEYFPGYRVAGERGYMTVELDDGKLVGCTHLTAIFPFYLEYELPFSSYLEQAREEITKLGTAFAGKKHILMGDFNTGPVVRGEIGEKNLTGEYPLNYDKLMSFGYRGPYMEQDGRCTFCGDNPLTQRYPNNVIDQILVNPPGAFSTPMAERAFDKAVPPLSDHYGTRVKVCDP